ncbi:MAG: N-acetyl-gamma-glutamyl-phosphate reductase [Alicyclobacillus sp.]|nr:N-acetyl-gamma-glutamyl-phosphate reductase [Alicyclobacillus sp.]
MAVQSVVRVGVVGATGYAGAELVRTLLAHPGVRLTYLAASSDGPPLSETYPNLQGADLPPLEAFAVDRAAQAADCLFVALPSGTSGAISAELWRQGCRVIDLSGDLRLPGPLYQQWYPHAPVDPAAQTAAVYGLTEWFGDALADASLVANPGCYATAVLLALLPLARAGWLTPQTPVHVDAKSGVSGAGRSAKLPYTLAELGDNLYAYKVGLHQHTPEIEQVLGTGTRVLLTTQLLPMIRGIYACMYIPWRNGPDLNAVAEAFARSYAGKPFVHARPAFVPQLKAVRGSNTCHIGWHWDERTETLLVMSAIDNLQKGAAGQAVQNFNRMYRWSETLGLSAFAVYP